MGKLIHEELSKDIIGAAMTVLNELKPGLEEKLQRAAPPWRNDTAPLLISRIFATYPKLGEAVSTAAVFLLRDGALEARDRELLLLRICALSGAEYEWGIHACGYSAASGLSENTIEATFSSASDAAHWSDRERLLIQLAEEFESSADISDQLWNEIRAVFSEQQILELLFVAGFYRLIAFTVNAVRAPPEAWAMTFPYRTKGVTSFRKLTFPFTTSGTNRSLCWSTRP